MIRNIYSKLQWKIIVLTLLVTFTPLLLLGVIIYRQFAQMYTAKIKEQIQFRAESRADAVDLFLTERTAILGAIADTDSLRDMTDEAILSHKLAVMNLRAGAFVDLGVIDRNGQQLAYVGPYDLKGKNYFDQPWFGQVMSRGHYISDVYLGFPQAAPFHHRRPPPGAAGELDPAGHHRSGHLRPDRPGGAHRQDRRRLFGQPGRPFADQAALLGRHPRYGAGNPDLVRKQTMTFEQTGTDQRQTLFAGTWLKAKDWLLVISGDVESDMAELFANRNIQILIIGLGIVAIVATTVFTTRTMVNQLVQTETRMKEMDAQLVQSDKLAALGKMAAGVAHEINNPLAVILQKTGWLQDLLDEEEFQKSPNAEEFHASIKKIEEHVERARKVVHNMLGYARRMEPRLEDVDVNQTINQTVDLLENYARNNNIDIQTDLSPKLPIIAGDQAQLQQVILNLVSNAIDAIGKDGTVSVASSADKSHIRVMVGDDGPGIPESMQKKVFDPFFTTKSTGKGTGLGLWISYSIIEKMGGTLSLQSREGGGATFTIALPIVQPTKK